MSKYTVVDLFCGCGGFTSGLTRSGLNVIAGVDIWNKAIETYKNNFDHISICQDLTKLKPEEFKQSTKIDRFDVLVGGPPCQGFSMAGKRDNKDPRNSLFMEYLKYLNYYKPLCFIMENVPGILSMKTAKNEFVIDIIMSEFNKFYNCKYYKLTASDYGVPQNRKRVVFIGFRKDLNIDPTMPPVILTKDQHIAVKTVLQKREDVDIKYFLSPKAIEGINKKRAKMILKNHGFGAQYLNPDSPSFTIPARYWKDGYDALVKYSNTEIRRLTEDELKKIQSFPDDFVFSGSKKDIIIQIGNAVASTFAMHLGNYITDKLNSISVIKNITKIRYVNNQYQNIMKKNKKQLTDENKKLLKNINDMYMIDKEYVELLYS